MISSKHLFTKGYLNKMKGGSSKSKSKSKKGGMSDIKTVRINLQPQYMGGQNSEPNFNNNDYEEKPSEENLEEVDVEEQQVVEPEQQVVEPEPEVVEAEPEVDDTEVDEDDTEVEVEEAEPEVEEAETEKKTKKQVLVPQLFGFRDQLKMYHWQTKSHSRHVASGDFVTNLTEFIDTFVEVYQGKYGRIQLDNIVSIKLKNMNDTTVIDYLNKYKNYLLYTIPGTLDNVKDTDLLNLKDEMLAEANKLLYLFTLR